MGLDKPFSFKSYFVKHLSVIHYTIQYVYDYNNPVTKVYITPYYLEGIIAPRIASYLCLLFALTEVRYEPHSVGGHFESQDPPAFKLTSVLMILEKIGLIIRMVTRDVLTHYLLAEHLLIFLIN